MVYVDLNMVRAGGVQHPAEWEVGGYHEIQRERERYRIVDRVALAEALGVALPELAEVQRELGGRGRYRVIVQGCEDYLLRESSEPYGLNSAAETAAPRRESARMEGPSHILSMTCGGATPGGVLRRALR